MPSASLRYLTLASNSIVPFSVTILSIAISLCHIYHRYRRHAGKHKAIVIFTAIKAKIKPCEFDYFSSFSVAKNKTTSRVGIRFYAGLPYATLADISAGIHRIYIITNITITRLKTSYFWNFQSPQILTFLCHP